MMAQFHLDFAKAAIVVILAAIWAADVFLRAVDTPVVNLTRRIEKAFFDD